MIKLKINNREIEADEGTTVLEAARSIGIEIPHFCYHPLLSKVGSCRLCQVEFKAPGRPRLDVSCRTPVAEGMEVETHSEGAVKARADVLEFLLANHPLDCPICDESGACDLQNYAFEHGFAESCFAEDKRKDRKRKRLGGHIIHDAERCVLCTRCVRFMEEIAGAPQLAVTGRGDKSMIDTFPDREIDSDYSGNLVDICPVGALTLEEFRFKVRNWHLSPVASVCPYCSRGCNINLDVRQSSNRLFRVRARENPDVNRGIICNEGRLRPLEAAAQASTRLLKPLTRGIETGLNDTLGKAASRLKNHEGKLLVIASPRRTLEELYLISKVFKPVEGARFLAASPEKDETDGILRTGENAPNMKGLRLLNFEVLSLDSLGELMAAPDTDGLVLLDASISLNQEMLSTFRFTMFMDYTTGSVAETADIAIPGLAWFEKNGTFINNAGRVQRIRPALATPCLDMADDIAVLANLAQHISGEQLPSGASEVFDLLAGECEALGGLDYIRIGEGGALPEKKGGDHDE